MTKQEGKLDLRSEQGFTLMELIVVIGVIAILIAILLPQFNGYTDKANAVSAKSNAKTALTAVSTYKTEIDTVNKIWEQDKAEEAIAKAFGETDKATLLANKKIDITVSATAVNNITIATQKGDLTFTTTLEIGKGQMGKTLCTPSNGSTDTTRCATLKDAGSVD